MDHKSAHPNDPNYFGLACPVCGHEPGRVAWTYLGQVIYRCPACTLEYAAGMPAASLEYYQQQYSSALIGAVGSGQVHPGYQYVVEIVRRIQDRYLGPRQRRALDVGCGSGYLLAQIEQMGFDALGIDFDSHLVEFARTHFQVRAEVGRVEDLSKLASGFDLVLLIHVLEHVEHPFDLLTSIGQVLAPEGILLIEVPNADRFALNRSLRRGELEWGEYPPHHLTFWTVNSLKRALELAGYTVLECRPRPFSRDERLEAYLRRLKSWPFALRRSIHWLAKFVGEAARLQGDTVVAIARRQESSPGRPSA